MKNEIIKDIQNQVETDDARKILHILNGSCMLEDFQKSNLMSETAVYVPFNEATCWGEVDEKIFSAEFIKKRYTSLSSAPVEYERIVMEPLEPLFKEQFDIIVLWFGDDMFCQMNFITLLAYLDQINFEGDVLFCMKQEQRDEMLPGAIEIDIEGYHSIYKTIMCDREKCDQKMLPVTYQAMNLYLDYLDPNGEIMCYIRNNLYKENLIEDLFILFPQYGLGDLQYKWMIEAVNKEK